MTPATGEDGVLQASSPLMVPLFPLFASPPMALQAASTSIEASCQVAYCATVRCAGGVLKLNRPP